MPPESHHLQSTSLRDFLSQVTAGETEGMPAGESWEQTIERIHVVGRIHRISDEVFDYFLEVLPPRWMRGNYFAFAEGQDPLQLFWSQRGDADAGEYFTRCLDENEIDQFCRLTRIPRDYGGYYGSEF